MSTSLIQSGIFMKGIDGISDADAIFSISPLHTGQDFFIKVNEE